AKNPPPTSVPPLEALEKLALDIGASARSAAGAAAACGGSAGGKLFVAVITGGVAAALSNAKPFACEFLASNFGFAALAIIGEVCAGATFVAGAVAAIAGATSAFLLVADSLLATED